MMFLILQSQTPITEEFLIFLQELKFYEKRKISLKKNHYASLFAFDNYDLNLVKVIEKCQENQIDYHIFDKNTAQKLANTLNIKREVNQNNDDGHFFGLIAMDMDSTLITIECIDELADIAGKKTEVSAITQATMEGKITNFSDSLIKRVRLLKGLPIKSLQEVLAKRMQYMNGVIELIDFAHEYQLKTVLLSGGFTYFSSYLQKKLNLTHHFANQLVIDSQTQTLTGEVTGIIIDGKKKKELVAQLCHQYNLSVHQAIAVGDGANDLPMICSVGLGIAAHAKPLVQTQAPYSLNFVGLEGIVAFFKLFENHQA